MKAAHAVTHPASQELRLLKKTERRVVPLSEDELRRQLVAEVEAELTCG